MKLAIRLFAFLIVLCIFFAGTGSVLAAPPENFQVQQIVGSGLDGPSGFAIAPDGRIFILERTGKVKVYKNGELLAEPFVDLPSIASGDRGLIGIAFDPDFGVANHYVYFYYTGLDKLNRLVRYSADTDVGTNGPFVLYQTTFPSEELHVGGSVQFGPDGKLYFAVGDNGYPPNAQNLSNPHGKILRINKDGSIPVDNPFFGQPGALPEIWAYGMRNPWRFQFDSATGELYGGDVGDYTWEEVNHIVKGGNYGWPAAEGLCTGICPYINPLYAYNHDGMSSAVTGGPIYRSTLFPEEYQGDLFFGDYARGFIRGMNLDEAGNNTGVYDFDTNAGAVVDLKVAPDGSMYYITYWPGRLYKISYSTGNDLPIANATADVTKGIEPLTVNFSSEGSYDPDEDPITYLWDFGDGTTSTEANPVKTYSIKGTYTVELTVSDGENFSPAIPLVIQVGLPPTVTIGAPVEGMTYRAGDEISYTAHAIDAAGFDLNDANIKTEIFLHHDTHFHPFLGPLTGRAGSFTIPEHGEASANTWFEIKVTATDESGLSDTKSVAIYPETSTITLDTVPAGFTVNIDGVPKTAQFIFAGVEQFKRELFAPTIQYLEGVPYQFNHWENGMGQRTEIITPLEDTTYTAVYQPAVAYTAEYFDNRDLAGEPALTRTDPTIDFAWDTLSPDPLVPEDNFSVRWTKDQYFASGKYRFTATVDDNVRLYIDGDMVIDKWVGGYGTHTADIILTEGTHEIVMEYVEEWGGAVAKLSYDLTADQPVVQTGYTAEYFDNMTLSGTPVVTKIDEAIAFAWDGNAPFPSLPVDGFSARWTKTETLAAGEYEFHVTADDGVRLFIDGELVLDKWIDQPATEYAVTKNLTVGSHTIALEYYENGGGAVVLLDYHKHGDIPVAEGFAGQYFANKTLTGDPVFQRDDAAINFDWGGTSPDVTVPVDNFSARWTKEETFEAGTYEFTVTADDGVRLLVDGEVLIDKWIDQAATTYKVQKDLTAGDHTIVVEYFETGGGALAKFSYAVTSTPEPTDGYTAEYFNNMTFAAPVVLTRTDAAIDFDWAGASPDPLINANNFSVRWTKAHTFTEGTYEFTVTADDGIRLLVDGEVLIDKWIDQAATTYTAQKELTAGEHTIVVEYFENGGGAVAKMQFAKIAGPDPDPEPEPTTDYTTKFWNLPSAVAVPEIPVTTPDLTRIDTTIDFDWKNLSPGTGINDSLYVAQWVKTATFEDGAYTFKTTSDDGIRFYIDDVLVLDQWNDHAATTHTIEKVMTAGTHTIRVEYYEKWGDAIAKFTYTKGGIVQPPTEQPEITSYIYNNGLENNWVSWSWDSIIDFEAILKPFSGDKHITWSPNNAWAGLHFHSDTGFDTTGYNEITFVMEATKENQKAQIILLDDANMVIGNPVNLADYGGDPVVGEYRIYTIPLSVLGGTNRVINGMYIQDISGEATNELYVDSIGFTGDGGNQLIITGNGSDEESIEEEDNTGGDVSVATGESTTSTMNTQENGNTVTVQTLNEESNSATDSADISNPNN